MAGPPLTLITAADSSALDAACRHLLRQAGPSAVLITADAALESMHHLEGDSTPEWTTHTFVSFSRRLLEQAGSCLKVASPLQRRWLIYRHAPSWYPAAGGSGPVPSGLRRLLQSWWLRMEAHGITPDQLNDLAPECDYPQRADELSGLLAALQRGLGESGLITDAALPAAAALEFSRGGCTAPRVLILHGLERLTLPQLQLLETLAQAGTAVNMTMWYDATRPAVCTDLNPIREALHRRFDVTVIETPATDASSAPEAVIHLQRHLWGAGAPPKSASGQIRCVEAPDCLSEAEQVARLCVDLHTQGTEWPQIVIVSASLDSSLPVLADQFSRFQIPWYAPERRSIPSRHPAHLLQALWQMTVEGLSHHSLTDLMDALPQRIPPLERQRLLEWSLQIDPGTPPHSILPLLDNARLDDPTRELLKRLVHWISASRQCQTLTQRCILLRSTASALASAERSDIDSLSRLLDTAHAAARLADSLYTPADGEAFVRDVWDDLQPDTQEVADAVSIVSLKMARWIKGAHIHLFGMQEGVLPSRVTDDPVLGADLCRLLNSRYDALLPDAADEAAMERRRFLQICGRTTGGLSFSWSRLSGDSDLQRSSWIEPLLRLFEANSVPVRIIRQHQLTPAPIEAIDEPDRRLIAADRLFDRSIHTRPEVTPEDLTVLQNWLYAWRSTHPSPVEQWIGWHRGVQRPRLHTRSALPDELRLSVGALQDLISCPFRWFARHRLGLTSNDYRYTTAQARWLRRAATAAESEDPETLWINIIRTDPPRCSPGERTLLLDDTLRLMRAGAEREAHWDQRARRRPKGRRIRFGEQPPGSSEPACPPLTLPVTSEMRLHISGQLDRLDLLPDNHTALTVYYRQLPADWWEQLGKGLLLEVILGVSATKHSLKLNPSAVWLDCAISDTRCSILLVDTGSASAAEACKRQPGEPSGLHRFAGDAIWSRALQQTASRIRSAIQTVQTGEIRPQADIQRCAACPWRILCRIRPTPQGGIHDGEPLDAPDGSVTSPDL